MFKVLFSLCWQSFCYTYSFRQYWKHSQWGLSHCDGCQSSLKWWMKIPILSFLLLRGRCANCGCSLSIVGFLLEVLALISGILWCFSSISLIEYASLMWVFHLIAMQDAYSERIDGWKLMVLSEMAFIFHPWNFDSLQGGMACGLILLAQVLDSKWIGDGDVWLIGIFVFILSMEWIHLWLVFSSGTAILFALWTKQRRIPFGPWLILSGWLLLILG